MKKMIFTALSALLLAGSADAKWWIFGKTGGEVSLKYLTVAGISAEESGGRITLYSEALGPGGTVKVQGRAQAGRSRIGSVRVSLDDKDTWQEAKLSDNGTFEYSFTPEEGKKYVLLVEVTDTAGRMNKVDETRRELSLSAEKMQAKVREALDAMFEAYGREQLQPFMARVGDDFAGDKLLLERAVKKDFDALSNIVMRYTLNNITSGASGRIFVSITYNRMVMVNKTGASNTDSGSTEFVFSLKEGKPVLYSMKQPLMFGLSDAGNVATGESLGNTATALTLDESGDIGATETVTIDCRTIGTVMKYTFASGAQACDTSGGGADIWFYDWANDIGTASVNHKAFSKSLTSLTASEVKVPASYVSGNVTGIMTGNAYCFDLSPDFYCVEPVTIPTPGNDISKFKLKKF